MKARYEPIVWNESLMTGVASIDEQHQILVSMLNEANYRLSESSSREVLEEIVHDLMSYALYHFDNEEEMMVEKAYTPEEKEAHFREHRNFSAMVAGLQQDLKQGKLIPREELLAFLNGWLIDHILNTDMRFARFLDQAGA